jgi:hypothetical protein
MAEQPTRDPVIDLLDTTQRETQELVGALFQVQMERLRDMVTRDLRDQTVRLIESRFSQLELTLRPRMARARLEVARGVTQVLNECFSRMRRFESDRHWCEAMLDAAGAMSRRCAFFSVRGDDLCLQGARGLENNISFPPSEVPYVAAPAFHRVITSARTLSVARSAAELSLPIAAMFGSDHEARALLVPISTADRVPGVLYAEDPVDPSAIEVVALVAGAVLEKHLRLFEPVRSTGGPIRSVAVQSGDSPPLPEEPRELELAAPAPPPAGDVNPARFEAERFARVAVARLLLEKTATISEGRRHRNLYARLRTELDLMRNRYRGRFEGTGDFLHSEMVRTLALNDTSLLGREYPGPLA